MEYVVNAYFDESAELMLRTNDIWQALSFAKTCWNEEDCEIEITDGRTGEVLLHPDPDNPQGVYMTPEMWLMWFGFDR